MTNPAQIHNNRMGKPNRGRVDGLDTTRPPPIEEAGTLSAAEAEHTTHDDEHTTSRQPTTGRAQRHRASAEPFLSEHQASGTPPGGTQGTRLQPTRFFPRQALLPNLSPSGEVVAWLLDWWVDALCSWSGVSSGDYGFPMMSPLWNCREFRELRRCVGLLAVTDQAAYLELSGWFFECGWVRRWLCSSCGRVAVGPGFCSHGRRHVTLRVGLVRVPGRGAEPLAVASAVADVVGLWRGRPRVPSLLAEAWSGRAS